MDGKNGWVLRHPRWYTKSLDIGSQHDTHLLMGGISAYATTKSYEYFRVWQFDYAITILAVLTDEGEDDADDRDEHKKEVCTPILMSDDEHDDCMIYVDATSKLMRNDARGTINTDMIIGTKDDDEG